MKIEDLIRKLKDKIRVIDMDEYVNGVYSFKVKNLLSAYDIIRKNPFTLNNFTIDELSIKKQLNENTLDKLRSYISILNNESFKLSSSQYSEIKYIFEDLYDKFDRRNSELNTIKTELNINRRRCNEAIEKLQKNDLGYDTFKLLCRIFKDSNSNVEEEVFKFIMSCSLSLQSDLLKDNSVHVESSSIEENAPDIIEEASQSDAIEEPLLIDESESNSIVEIVPMVESPIIEVPTIDDVSIGSDNITSPRRKKRTRTEIDLDRQNDIFRKMFATDEMKYVNIVSENRKLVNNDLNEVRLRDLFKKCGYDQTAISCLKMTKNFFVASEEVNAFEYIRRLGDYKNIEDILELFSHYKVKIGPSNAAAITTLLVMSKAKNIDSIISMFIRDEVELGVEYIMEYIISNPSIAIDGIVSYGIRPKPNNVFKGAYENFKCNLDYYFANIGNNYNFKNLNNNYCSRILRNCKQSHNLLLEQVEVLKKYGLNINSAIDVLFYCGIGNATVFKRFDWFVELKTFDEIGDKGLRNIVESNISLLKITKEDTMFQIINSIRSGVNDIYIEKDGKIYFRNSSLKSFHDDKNNEIHAILDENGNMDPCHKFDGDLDALKDIKFDKNIILNNETLLTHPFIKMLEENVKESELLYNFNGIYISRMKVLRICNVICQNGCSLDANNLLFAASYESILTEDMYNELKTSLYKVIGEYSRGTK